MTAKYALLFLAPFALASTAQADVEFCNHSDNLINLAYGYSVLPCDGPEAATDTHCTKDDYAGFVSTGWLRISPRDCQTIVVGDRAAWVQRLSHAGAPTEIYLTIQDHRGFVEFADINGTERKSWRKMCVTSQAFEVKKEFHRIDTCGAYEPAPMLFVVNSWNADETFNYYGRTPPKL